MGKIIRILSIDFDYFQNVPSKDIFAYYPDGHDLSTQMSMFIWSNIYASEREEKEIKRVKIWKSELDMIKGIIKRLPASTPNWIVNSHIHMYDAVKKMVEGVENPDVRIINIDMHHDCFNDNPELDCGNWVSHVQKDFGAKVRWIANPVGLDVYDISNWKDKGTVDTSIDCIKDCDFDAVFLCRSDIWFPPHLDKYFEQLRRVMTDTFTASYTDGCVNEPRDIWDAVKQTRESRAQWMKQYKEMKSND